MKLAILGPSQSGKTCLAVGLANSSYGKTLFKRAFVSTANGDASRDYLTKLRIMLAGAEWPAGTKDPKARTLDFEFQWENKKVEFSFDDYNGENVTKKEFRARLENLCEEDGVVLLVNTGFSYSYIEEPTGRRRLATDAEVANGKTDFGLPVLKASAFEDSPVARKWLVELEKIYEQLIEDLSTQNGGDKSGKPIVALTVSASDRLRSDLSDIRPQFEAFLEKIKNRLDAGCFKWESFEVSITGILENQAKPKLAGGLANTSAEPFLWLLGKLAWRIRIQVWAKRAMFISAIAAIISLCVGTYLWIDAGKKSENIYNWETQCKNILGRIESNSTNVKAELAKAIELYKRLRAHRGFGEQKAKECADRLEDRIWCVQKRLIEDKIRRIGESQGEMGNVTDCNEVENLLEIFAPSSPSNATAVAYNLLRARWNANKEGFQEANYRWQLGAKVKKPLREMVEDHGEAVIGKLYALYDTIRSIEVKSPNIGSIKIELSTNLDLRVENEWRKFAIPDFELASSTNATHANTRKFFDLFCVWPPASTNGIVAKDKLMIVITNSIPKWRDVYEKTKFKAKIDEAVKSGRMMRLAELYPDRVAKRGETNDYLTTSYVSTQWEQRVKGEYSDAYSNYVSKIISDIERRCGRPVFTDNDRSEIDTTARSVGSPFCADETKNEVKKIVNAKADEWDTAKKTECNKWVQCNVRTDRNRTGSNSLWDDYVKFMRRNRESNPFAEKMICPAVYKLVEKWFELDVQRFSQLKHDDGYVDAVEKAFEPFKFLCRRVSEDKTPLKTSWAWHFACDCVNRGKIDSFSTCFPQCLTVTDVEGQIDYNGYRKTYKGTVLSVDMIFMPLDGNNILTDLVVGYKFSKKQNRQWVTIPFQVSSRSFHLFDVVGIRLFADDQVHVGCNEKCKAGNIAFQGSLLGIQKWSSGVYVGGELSPLIPLIGNSDFPPYAYIKVYGTVSGDSIADFMEKAKNAAAKEQERLNGK